MRKEMGSFKPYLSPAGAIALSFGSTIGWGAFLIPGTSFLPKSGVLGSLIGLTPTDTRRLPATGGPGISDWQASFFPPPS